MRGSDLGSGGAAAVDRMRKLMCFLNIAGCKHVVVDTQKKKYTPENLHNMGALSLVSMLFE